jgi:hypothetical protein
LGAELAGDALGGGTHGAAMEPQPGTRWRVLLDPAGHPFCITTVTPSPEMMTTASQ